MCQMSERCQMEEKIKDIKNQIEAELESADKYKKEILENEQKRITFTRLLKNAKNSIKW